MATMTERVASRHLVKLADQEDGLDIVTSPLRGSAFLQYSRITPLMDVARELNTWFIQKLRGYDGPVMKPKGAVRAFSFQWSNAQQAWDVILVRPGEFPRTQDLAEFTLFLGPEALSPLGKLWSLVEMKYVAKALKPLPF
jgi:hypothetical protein